MVLSQVTNQDYYKNKIIGYFGSFQTKSGLVSYVQTKACLGFSTDDHSRLVGELVPVREVLDVTKMDFDQLLQRDLDDHRVSTELIPYLLENNSGGASFFPPIVAVLLPFEGNEPKDNFSGVYFEGEQTDCLFGKAISSGFRGDYRVDRLFDENTKKLNSINLAQLNWQPENSKLVVIDGQHRAMAILALYRTINGKWSGPGERYKAFYVESINKLLGKYSKQEKENLINGVEIPVNIIFFPKIEGESASQHVAARKLFVDVNQNARKPSLSRLKLLSDRLLMSVFLRATLNDFRQMSHFPISAVEYDNPDSDEQSKAKWCAITNANNISSMILRSLCGPKDPYFNVESANPPTREKASDLRKQLAKSLYLDDVMPSSVTEDGVEYKRAEISDDFFPPKKIPMFKKQYLDGWGFFIKIVFLELAPYKVHCETLEELVNGWSVSDSQSRLASDAISEGAGVFWTLRDSYHHFSERNKELVAHGKPKETPTDSIKSWEILEAKRREFEELRAKNFLGSKKDTAKSQACYSMYETAACQIGICLAARVLWDKAYSKNNSFSSIKPFSEYLVKMWNVALQYKDRKLFVVKDHQILSNKRFNLLDKLDTPRSLIFRYFWLQLLAADDIREQLVNDGLLDIVALDNLVSAARFSYRKYLVKIRFREIKKNDPSINDLKAQTDAEGDVDKSLRSGLGKFFGIKSEDYKKWVEQFAVGASGGGVSTNESDTDSDDDSETEALEGDSFGGSLDTFLEDVSDEEPN